MNTLELLDKKQQLKQKAEELIAGAETAVRKLNEGEQAEFESILKEIEETDAQIRKIETENLKQTTSKRSMEKFSLLKAINDVANNRQLVV